MARIRTIKPSFFKSDDVSALPLRARLTWIGLWTQCDDQGRTKDHVKLIKADVWPLDQVSLADVEEDLVVLAAHGRIVRYKVGGERYLAITNWNRHQKINRPTASNIPPPPNGLASAEHCASEPKETGSYPQVSAPGALTEDSPGEGKGKEGKGREGSAREAEREAARPEPLGPRPSPKCTEHQNDPDPPACRRCRTAREAAAAWDLADADRRRNAPQCRIHRGQLAHNCGPCRADALAGDGP